MIPPTLLKEAEAAEKHNQGMHGGSQFVKGVNWLSTRLLEISEGEFDAPTISEFNAMLLPKYDDDHHYDYQSFNEGARHQHALSQAALLKAREEISEMSKLVEDATNEKIALSAKCERMEWALRKLSDAVEQQRQLWAEHAVGHCVSGYVLDANDLARQALSGAAE